MKQKLATGQTVVDKIRYQRLTNDTGVNMKKLWGVLREPDTKWVAPIINTDDLRVAINTLEFDLKLLKELIK